MKLFNIKFFFIVATFLSFMGCSRPSDEKKSLVVFDVGKINKQTQKISQSVGAQNIGEPRVIIINITGPGIPPQYYFWEKCWEANTDPADCEPGTITTPSSIAFEVPKGSSRLFQVLAAYEDLSTGGISFKYGDRLKSLTAETEVVSIGLASVGGGGSQFDFGGRYCFNTESNCPSGVLTSYYTPSGKPRMKIEDTYMFNGFFQAFGIKNANFDYILTQPDGSTQEIFSDMNPDTIAYSNYIMRINVGAHFRYDSSISSWYSEGERDWIVGYYNHLPTAQVCFVNSPTFTNDIFSNYCAQNIGALCNADNRFDYASSFGAIASTESTTLNDIIYIAAGGVGNPTCPLSDPFSSFSFTPPSFNTMREDSIFSFSGPFSRNSLGSYITIASGTPGTWEFDYVAQPGVNSAFDGIDMYYKDGIMSGFDYDMFYLNCSTLPSDGFSLALDSYSATDPDLEALGDISGSALVNFSSNGCAIICPYKIKNGIREYLVGTAQYQCIP